MCCAAAHVATSAASSSRRTATTTSHRTTTRATIGIVVVVVVVCIGRRRRAVGAGGAAVGSVGVVGVVERLAAVVEPGLVDVEAVVVLVVVDLLEEAVVKRRVELRRALEIGTLADEDASFVDRRRRTRATKQYIKLVLFCIVVCRVLTTATKQLCTSL
jgi:hypothetical protein